MKALREIALTLILALVIFVVMQATVQQFVVIGNSMLPSFQNNERLLVNKAVYIFRQPQRGEVVVFRHSKETDYIKRIIGLPGDTVEVKKNKVYVNGSALNEPYINNAPDYTFGPEKIPEGQYFVLGDNRDNSDDSHSGWVVPRDDIVGKAWILIWPPDNWGLVPSYPLAEQLVSAAL
ncbi:MAG: signal peptidase I [Chloroflexota bacterium]